MERVGALHEQIRRAARRAGGWGWLALGLSLTVPCVAATWIARMPVVAYARLGDWGFSAACILVVILFLAPLFLALQVKGRSLQAACRQFLPAVRALSDGERRALLTTLVADRSVNVLLLACLLADSLGLHVERAPAANAHAPHGRRGPFQVVEARPPDPRVAALVRAVSARPWGSILPSLLLLGMGMLSATLLDRWLPGAIGNGPLILLFLAPGLGVYLWRYGVLKERIRAGLASLPPTVRREALLALRLETDSDVSSIARTMLRRQQRAAELTPATDSHGSEPTPAPPTS